MVRVRTISCPTLTQNFSNPKANPHRIFSILDRKSSQTAGSLVLREKPFLRCCSSPINSRAVEHVLLSIADLLEPMKTVVIIFSRSWEFEFSNENTSSSAGGRRSRPSPRTQDTIFRSRVSQGRVWHRRTHSGHDHAHRKKKVWPHYRIT